MNDWAYHISGLINGWLFWHSILLLAIIAELGVIVISINRMHRTKK